MFILRILKSLIYRASCLFETIIDKVCFIRVKLVFMYWGIKHSSFKTKGIPYLLVGGEIIIGKDFSMNNNICGNPIGFSEPCLFACYSGAKISIGDHVGISSTALVAMADIIIENYVKIGGGGKIYTTDFHSLQPDWRKSNQDKVHRIIAPVTIKENAFIGAGVIILKGVTIGRNAIVGAGSVVTKSIPDNEIWAGNPAHFIKKIG